MMILPIILIGVGIYFLIKKDYNQKTPNSEELLKKQFVENKIDEESFIKKMKIIKENDN